MATSRFLAAKQALGVIGPTLGVLLLGFALIRILGGAWWAYGVVVVVAVVAFVVAYIIIRSFANGIASEGAPDVLFSGPLLIGTGKEIQVLRIHLDAGQVIDGSLMERSRKRFSVALRPRRPTRSTNHGPEPTYPLFQFDGTSTSGFTSLPAPASDTYYFEFKQEGDLSGREIQVNLRRRKA